MEDYFAIKTYLDAYAYEAKVVIAYQTRELDFVQSILMANDKAANFNSAKIIDLVNGDLEAEFNKAVKEISEYQVGIFVGDFALSLMSNVKLFSDISNLESSFGFLSDQDSELASAIKVLFPVRTVLEKSGMLINKDQILQYSERAIDFSNQTHPEWRLFNSALKLAGIKSFEGISDRDQSLNVISSLPKLNGLSIKELKKNCVVLS